MNRDGAFAIFVYGFGGLVKSGVSIVSIRYNGNFRFQYIRTGINVFT
jgi:hypothetical protein